jgi:hypothetical protein
VQPASGSLVFTFRKSNADTAITVTQAAAAAALLADTASSLRVSAGYHRGQANYPGTLPRFVGASGSPPPI